MISCLKCNFLRNQEMYDINEYIICLLIQKSWNWCFFGDYHPGSLQGRFCRYYYFIWKYNFRIFLKSNYYLALQITWDSQVVNVFIYRGWTYKGLKYLIHSLHLTIISPTKSFLTLKTVTLCQQSDFFLYFYLHCYLGTF